MEKLPEIVNDKENMKFRHFSIFPGILNSIEGDKDFGKPIAFFVREDGCQNTRLKGDILDMISGLKDDDEGRPYLDELGDFIVGTNSSDEVEVWAQSFCQKINEPEFQEKIFTLYKEKRSLLKRLEDIKSEADSLAGSLNV